MVVRFYYELMVPRRSVRYEQLLEILKFATGQLGFSIYHTDADTVDVRTGEKSWDHVKEIEDLPEEIASVHSSVELWKGMSPVSVCWNPDGEDDLYDIIYPRDTIHFGLLHFTTSYSHSWTWDDSQKKWLEIPGRAEALEKLFLKACELVSPPYGYASSTDTDEDVGEYWTVQADVLEGRKLSWLSWLNYFSRDYFYKIGRERFEKIECRIEDVGISGVAVYLFDNPWKGNSNELFRVNELWRNVP